MTLQEKRTAESAFISEGDAQEEIQKFVKAVSSYPAHFASNPEITFEEHLLHVSGETGETGGGHGAGD